MHTNPIVGTGYENFWLGPRLFKVWALTGPGINEPHNGYLDIYLNLGILGLILVVTFLVVSYRTVCIRLKRHSSLGSFGAAMWSIILFSSTTEAVLKNGLPWTVLLLGTLIVPREPRRRDASASGFASESNSSLQEPIAWQAAPLKR